MSTLRRHRTAPVTRACSRMRARGRILVNAPRIGLFVGRNIHVDRSILITLLVLSHGCNSESGDPRAPGDLPPEN